MKTSSIPVIAIGGIGPANAAQIIRQGAAGIAVMSGICGADDPYEAAKAIHMAVHSWPGDKSKGEGGDSE
ncbi:Regulatory protein TenI [compost metagenome]